MTDVHTESVEKAILNFGERLNIKSLKGVKCLYSSLFTQNHYDQVIAYVKAEKMAHIYLFNPFKPVVS